MVAKQINNTFCNSNSKIVPMRNYQLRDKILAVNDPESTIEAMCTLTITKELIVKHHYEHGGGKIYQSNEEGRGNGLWYTKVKNLNGSIKRLSSTTYEGLLVKMFEFYDSFYTLGKVYEMWREHIVGTRNELTYLHDGFDYNRFIRGTPLEDMSIIAIKAPDIYKHMEKLVGNKQLTKKDLNKFKGLINHIFGYAVLNLNLNAHNPLKDFESSSLNFSFKVVNNDDKYYPTEDLMALREYILSLDKPSRFDIMIYLDTFTGMRYGEVAALTWHDFIPTKDGNYVINIVKAYDGRLHRIIDTKCHVHRKVPISRDMFEYLRNNLDITKEYLFECATGGLPKDQNLNQRLHAICDTLGIEYYSYHKIRFGVTTMLFEEGANAYDIQKLLGHSSIQMTEKYNRGKKIAGESVTNILFNTSPEIKE